MPDTKNFTNKEINKIVFDRIMETIEKEGKLPWNKPWSSSPMNGISMKDYRGINRLFLGSLGFEHPYFFTFNQVKGKNAQIKAGKKSFPVSYWKFTKFKDSKNLDSKGNPKIKVIPFLRYYNVWNIEDTTIDITPYKKESIVKNVSSEETSSQYLDREKLKLIFGGDVACYIPSLDELRMPTINSFIGTNEYYGTLFHELVHSTGHQSRLNREGVAEKTSFGSAMYSKEELVAEIGACFLCSYFNVSNTNSLNNSVGYITSWKSKLKEDETILMKAAGLADKAFDFILTGKRPGTEEILDAKTDVDEENEVFDFSEKDISSNEQV